MSEQCPDGLRCEPNDLRQAMAVHTRKITDACRDKDCVEDLRVYLTISSQQTLAEASSVRVRSARLLYTYMDVEPIAFDRNHYCIDITFYYQILADGVVGANRPAALTGLAAFSKRAVLCGEDSKAHIFTSDGELESALPGEHNLPTAVVEVLDPMILGSKVKEATPGDTEGATLQIPQAIRNMFDEDLVLTAAKQLLVTLGQFSIVRLERDVQIIVPLVEYAIPSKTCTDGGCCPEDPCELFSKIPFPAQQFTPTSCSPDCGEPNPC